MLKETRTFLGPELIASNNSAFVASCNRRAATSGVNPLSASDFGTEIAWITVRSVVTS
jgi:hypothetical protein